MTLATLRASTLDNMLGRIATATLPWSDTECENAIKAALRKSWSSQPRIGLKTTGDVASSSTTMEYTIPTAIGTVDGEAVISRIDLLDSSGLYVAGGQVTSFRIVAASKVVVKPLLASGYTLRFSGWKPLAVDASDLPARLEDAICHLAASLLYGALASKLGNYQRQQAIDSARVVTHQEAIGQSAYWLRLWQDDVSDDPLRISVGPRAARR